MRKITILILLLLSGNLFAQEVVTGLQFNKAVRERMFRDELLKSGSGDDTIPVVLPFLDDFSAGSVFPSALRWIDRYGFENNEYPVYPVDLGVVTLDAINDSGAMYPGAVSGPLSFIADHLTSRYIRLDSVFTPLPRKLTPADSVYLSFYYQPQGRGLSPHTPDSLILRFLLEPAHDSVSAIDTTPIPDRWKRVWATQGMPLDTFLLLNGRYFMQVMIPITDTLFFKNQFRLQFYNYVSLAGSSQPSWQSNCSQWNIDRVYLNTGRNLFDTVYPEIRFTEEAPSLLKNYRSMPYPQYGNDPGNEMQDTLSVMMTNRDLVQHSVKHSYQVTQVDGGFNKSYESPSFNLLPYTQYAFGYTSHPPVNFIFPISSADSGLFLVRHIIRDLTPGSLLADTLSAYQRFYNYFAYDDGTPEAGYGLKGSGAMMAYKFRLNKSPDTLRAVRIYFNQTLEKANEQLFNLTVWNDNTGIPGDTLYSRLVLPKFSDSLNEFVTYVLENPVKINTTFYVGTIQTTDDNLNIGLDVNDNASGNLFYNVTGSWISSSISGAPMVRPVIGKPIPAGTGTFSGGPGKLILYPNPCRTGRVHCRLPDQEVKGSRESWRITITTLTGETVSSSKWQETVDVSTLPAGLYFVEARQPGSPQFSVARLIILK